MKLKLTALLLSSSLLFGQEEAKNENVEELEPIVIESSPLKPSIKDSAQSWSVLEGEKLERLKGNTIGETLSRQPGISQSFFGPSASRPIIRGLDKYRVRILQNSLDSFDVSSSSEDHLVPIDPLLVDRIEILRGSSALMYGGNAIGGVVNVIDRSIPTQSHAGWPTGSFRTNYNSVNKGWNNGLNARGGNDSFSFQVNGLNNDYSEYDSPVGRVQNSMGDRSSYGFGGSHIMENGYAGLGFSHFDGSYNIPGEHAESQSRIEAKRDRFEFRTEIETSDSEWLQGIDFNLGYGDYEHSEIGLEGGVFETHSTYLREGIESRVSLLHEFGAFNGALGFHGNLTDFQIKGEGIFAGSTTGTDITKEDSTNLAVFLVEQIELNEDTQINAGFRLESLDRDYSGTSAPADRDDSAFSASAGVAHDLNELWNLSANLNYSERIPDSAELYSDGAHHATESYEIGNPALDIETAVGVEAVLRRTVGKVTGQLSGFYTRFNDYAFLEDTGVERDEDGNLEPVGGFPAGTEELPERKYESAKADFYGLEMEINWLAVENPGWSLLLSAYGDTLRGKNETEGNNLPRISPARVGFGFEVEQEKLNYGMDIRRTLKQDKISEHAGGGGAHSHAETVTEGYTLLNAFASYQLDILNSQGELFIRGYNLTDELAREHTSFLKNSAPLPGRGIEVGLQFDF